MMISRLCARLTARPSFAKPFEGYCFDYGTSASFASFLVWIRVWISWFCESSYLYGSAPRARSLTGWRLPSLFPLLLRLPDFPPVENVAYLGEERPLACLLGCLTGFTAMLPLHGRWRKKRRRSNLSAKVYYRDARLLIRIYPGQNWTIKRAFDIWTIMRAGRRICWNNIFLSPALKQWEMNLGNEYRNKVHKSDVPKNVKCVEYSHISE